jgi:hypothetical protein
MASNAKAHSKIYRDKAVHALDIAVTFGAINLCSHMRTMMKIDIIRNKIDTNPGNRSLLIIMLPLFQYLRMQRDDVAMAVKTLFYRWDPCILGLVDIRVTKTAIDLLDSCMDPMAKIDGLPRTDRTMRK